jgi:murein DD-endopeptidase MepM/ murein hydrolase activator NlpD
MAKITHKDEGYPCVYDTPLTGLDWLEWYKDHNVYHPGVDFNTGYGNDDLGNDVKAPKSGFVVYCHETVSTSRGFGKFIILQHKDGNYTRYAHLADIQVKEGQEIVKGKVIGHVGNTGTNYCHLHFEAFNEACKEKQIGALFKWRMYPSGWSKAKVQQYYLNPWEWLKNEQHEEGVPSWALPAVTWAKSHEIIRNFEGNAISDYELALVLYRFYEKFIKN